MAVIGRDASLMGAFLRVTDTIKKTLVLPRAKRIKVADARPLGLNVVQNWHNADLKMCSFLREIMGYLPESQPGDDWHIEK